MTLEVDDEDSQVHMQWEGVPRVMRTDAPGLSATAIPETSVDEGVISVDLHVLPIDSYL